MLYEELCNKYFDVQYFDKCVKTVIINIPNNKYDIRNLFFEILEIFRLDKVDVIIEYLDKVYLINYENDIKKFFKNI